MITNLTVSRTLAQGKLVVSVDATRPANDPYKLPAALLALLETGITELESDDSGTHAAEGDRAESSATVRGALEKIEAALRAGHAGIGALLSDSLLPGGISHATRLATYTTYGWAQGELGRFPDDRLLVLGELALQGGTTIATPAHRYAPGLVTLIRSQLDLIEAEEPTATGGGRQVSVDDRTTARDLLQTRISRARYHYCAATDDLDSTKELAKISFQPRRSATAKPGSDTPPVTPKPPAP